MSCPRAGLLLLSGLVLVQVPPAHSQPGAPQGEKAQAGKPPAGTDRHGDPLPPGAVARLGTVRWRPNADIAALVYSADGKTLVAGGSIPGYGSDPYRGYLALWDVATGKQVREFKTDKQAVSALAPAPDGRIMALGGRGKPRSEEGQTAYLWEVTTGKELHRFGGHTEMVAGAALSADGKLAATGDGRGVIRIWDTATGKEIRQFKEPRAAAGTLAFSRDGKLLASGEVTINTGDPVDVFVRVWDVATGQIVRNYTGLKDYVGGLVFSPDGKTLTSAGGGRPMTVLFWDVATAKEVRRFEWDVMSGKEPRRGENRPAVPRAFSPDGQTLALAGGNEIIFWDMASGKEKAQPADQSTADYPVAFSPDGTILASGGERGILLWDARTGALLRRLPGSHGSVAFSSDGKTLAAPRGDSEVSLWDVATGKERRRLPAPPAGKDGLVHLCWCVAFVRKKNIVAASYGDTVYLWDAATGEQLHRLAAKDQFAHVNSLASSPDGKLVAVGSGIGAGVFLWDVATGKLLRRLTWKKGKEVSRSLHTVAFSPDGKILACALGNHKAQFWDVATGEELKTLEWPNPPNQGSPFYLAYSPAGGVIATYGRDENVYLIDIATGKEVGRFVGQRGQEKAVAFSPDGKQLASTGDGTVVIWDVAGALRKEKP